MTTTPSFSIPVNIQQNTQPIVVQIDDDVLSLIPETTHMNKPITIVENLEKSLAKKITDPSKCEIAPSCMDACGSGLEPSCMSIPSPVQDVSNLDFLQSDDTLHDQDEETLQQVLDRVYETKIAELKNELKECQADAALKDEENKTFREELLNWVNRWKNMNLKKNRYKESKNSTINTNQHLIEQVNQQKLMIIKLKAKLSEARRVISLQNRT